jgi:hypothetical protein
MAHRSGFESLRGQSKSTIKSDQRRTSVAGPVTEKRPSMKVVVFASAGPVKPGCLPPMVILKSPGSTTVRPSFVITAS